jgi:hypothetical protein
MSKVFGTVTTLENIMTLEKGVITPGASANLNASAGVNVWTLSANQNETINSDGVQVAGDIWVFVITNDASSARTITFSTGFKPSATLVGTVSKSATIVFVSDGTNWYELCRTLLL